MSLIDKALKSEPDAYAKKYRKVGERPFPKIAVVTCMDPRLSDLPAILGLPHADIDVIRTGGPAVTEDVLERLRRFHPCPRNDGDHAPKSHRLRVHNVHRR